jgi:pilus assembly protein CpaE
LLLDLRPATSVVDAVRQRDRLDATLLRHLTLKHESGLRVLAAPADALEGAEVDDEAIARILNLARRSFRYVIVDTFPMIDNVVMSALDLTDTALVVVQPMAPSVAGAARLLPVLDGLGFQQARQRLVLNYSHQKFLGALRPIDIADQLQRTIDYVVPYDKRVLAATNTGMPQVLQARSWHGFRRAIDAIVDDLSGAASSAAVEEPPRASDDHRVRLGADRRWSLAPAAAELDLDLDLKERRPGGPMDSGQ